MAIMFHNVKSGERRLCETEPMIAAHLNSSDRSPNAHTGQDMGWRLAPSTVIELERLSKDPEAIRKIAADFGIPADDVRESDVLNWMSRKNDRSNTGETTEAKDFEREYENDILKLRREQEQRDQLIVQEARASGGTVPQRIVEQEQKKQSDSGNIDSEQSAPVNLGEMKRQELNDYAETVGIEKPEDYSNAPKLIEAIKAKEAEEE